MYRRARRAPKAIKPASFALVWPQLVDVAAGGAHTPSSRPVVGSVFGDGAGPGLPSLTGEPDLIDRPREQAERERFSLMKNKHRLERFEGAADLMTVGLIIALGAAMVVGLLTASGSVTW